MQAITIAEINQKLSALPTDKLVVVYDFISYLASQVGPEIEEVGSKPSMAILIPLDEYERLRKISEQKAAFYDLSRNLGRDVERQGVTEEEFLADIKQTKREIFEKQYEPIS